MMKVDSTGKISIRAEHPDWGIYLGQGIIYTPLWGTHDPMGYADFSLQSGKPALFLQILMEITS